MKNIAFLFLISVGFLLQSCSKDDDSVSLPKETILYQTDFSKDDGQWWVDNDGVGSGSYNNGQYWLASSSSQVYYTTLGNVFSTTTGTTAVEASIKLEYLNNKTDYGFGGIMFNYKKNGSNYSYMIWNTSYNGYWKLARYNSASGYTDYVDWTLNNAIRQNDFNKLRIEHTADKIRFYINGSEIYSMATTNGPTLDQVGLSINSYSRIKADYFKAVELK